MYLCATVPLPHLDPLASGPMAMALSHLVGDGDTPYARFFRGLSQAGSYVILNSGAFEAARAGRPLPTLDATLRRAERIGASEVQFPEDGSSGRRTIKLVESWVRALTGEDRRRYAWHAVVIGKTQRDYEHCFDALAEMEPVDVLGLPKIITARCYAAACGARDLGTDLATTRGHALERLLPRTAKPCHLLGLDDPREVVAQRRWGTRVRSVDTSAAVIHAVHGISYPVDPLAAAELPVDLPRFDVERPLGPAELSRAHHNLRILRAWCQEPSTPHRQGARSWTGEHQPS
jgi:hypothetical protein